MIYTTLGVLALAAIVVIGTERNRFTVAVSALSRPSTAVDEAERVLSRRYARGSVSAEEYDRMMAILRR